MEQLNSLDIDHVEIIKGAAAERLYGERARDGVIQIVTKAGAGAEGEFRVERVVPDRSTLRAKEVDGNAAAGDAVEWPTSGQIVETPIEIPVRGHAMGPSGREAAPLIVIDGVVQDESATMSDIGKLDIESVEIVKGETAIELYGERAKNGAIQIKTKGG
jgi:bla regulator protein blaR1